ncbi:MAG: DUF5703 domain-containing protein [Prevotellaceae bacterium]|nr:DUF5703 domain-containing protein [Prevotellaceae bacterium]
MSLKICLPLLLLLSAAPAGAGEAGRYSEVWTSQSANASESMPCGGGDVGLNVWAEGGELLFYIARSGAFDEGNALLKLGRVRLRFAPNPFAEGGDFRQELLPEDGYVKVCGASGGLSAEVSIWVDVHRPIVHVEVQSSRPLQLTAGYETWRYEDRPLAGKAANAGSYKWAPQRAPLGGAWLHRDSVAAGEAGRVTFFHRNRADLPNIFDVTVRQQGLDSVKRLLRDPITGLTFGGAMQGEGMGAAEGYRGAYAGTAYRGYALRSRTPRAAHHLTVALHTAQASPAAWAAGLDSLARRAAAPPEADREASRAWWRRFWERSYIVVAPDSSGAPPYQLGRTYQLQRYMLGCNARGQYPTKFNGGLFTYDPCLVDTAQPFTPDHRAWGGGTFTAQNQRLVHYPMLAAADFDLLKPQLDFYLRALPAAELRTKAYWGHGGACFAEQLENFGLPNCAEYGWSRPDFFDKGVEYNAWLEYEWDTALEFCFMALELHRYCGADIAAYLPLVESCLTFFDEHYRYLALRRGRKALDGSGHLVLYPGSACETYKMATNATSTIAALHTVLQRLIALPDSLLPPPRRAAWAAMLGTLPPIALREVSGHTAIAPAKAWERVSNTEAPQLYPVFPWGIYGLGRPHLEVAINTYRHDPDALRFRSHVGWKQDNIFAARLGLTDEAAALALKKLAPAEGRRFPTFWGPGFDWTPDHNHGGAGMVGLQEMLLQSNGDTLYLFPAWPKEWDVRFKLHAPRSTTVEATLRSGKIERLHVTPASRAKDVVVLLPSATTRKPSAK